MRKFLAALVVLVVSLPAWAAELTQAQKTTLKNHIATNNATTTTPGAGGQTFVISSRKDSRDPTDQQAIADWYNTTINWFVVKTNVQVEDVLNAIIWANFTPNPALTSQNAAQHNAATNACMLKRDNVLIILGNGQKTTFDASKLTKTGGLKDGLTGLPSGASFATQAAGWGASASAGVWSLMTRQCSNAEKLFASNAPQVAGQNALLDTGPPAVGTQGNAQLMGWEGSLSQSQIDDAELNG